MAPPTVTVIPDSLTLNPGESAQVNVAVDPLSDSGTISVVVEVTVPPQYDYLIEGDFEGTIGLGETAHIVGDVNQTGPVFVEGLLTGIDTFHWQGNGFTVFFQNGGQADLHGKFKAPWGPWGTDTTGWVTGDRIGVAPTRQTFNASGVMNGVYVPSEVVWSDWSMPRPTNSPDVTLVDGMIRKPEVQNLSQSIVLENLARGLHFHDSAGVQRLSDVKFLNCGTEAVLGNYPCHFHLLGENSRGSVIERVVVEGGKNHAFVPHGSHGITFRDCAAYNTIDDAYWWDPPPQTDPASEVNFTNDVFFDHCLAVGVVPKTGSTGHRLTAFFLDGGTGNRCLDSVAVGVQGGKNSSGFHWPEGAGGVWEFDGCVAHNCKSDGIFVWQNSVNDHVITNFTAYHVGKQGVEHGAYRNKYHYQNLSLTRTGSAMLVHALSKEGEPLIFEDVVTDGQLVITVHNQVNIVDPVIYRKATFTAVKLQEIPDSKAVPGLHRFEDCGLAPSDFDLALIHPDSIIEIVEGGNLAHRWDGGWS